MKPKNASPLNDGEFHADEFDGIPIRNKSPNQNKFQVMIFKKLGFLAGGFNPFEKY